MKFLVIPDKFKGSLSAEDACGILKEEILAAYPESEVITLPIADGGEGLTDTFLRAKVGKKVFIKAKNPFFEEIDASYALFPDKTAVIEVAEAAGLKLVTGRADTLAATTYGVGEMILDAAKNGAETVYVGLGGTATTDGGAGMLCALGAKFYNKDKKEFIPTGGTLSEICGINADNIALKGVKIICLADSLNPLFGVDGAAYVYAKQKGCEDSDIPLLDDGLRNFANVTSKVREDLSGMKGTGAAGGIGYAVVSYLGGEIRSGIDEVLHVTGFIDKLDGTDYVITGEGKFDNQSLFGKAVWGVARAAKRAGVKVILIAGVVKGVSNAELKEIGITAAFSTNRNGYTDFSDIQAHAKEDFRNTVNSVLALIKGE